MLSPSRATHWLRRSLTAAALCVGLIGAMPARADDTAAKSAEWAKLDAAIAASGIANITVLVGDASGRLYAYSSGDVTEESVHQTASAAKMLTASVIMAVVRSGKISLSDHPQEYLDWWTNDPKDPRSKVTLEHLLAFTSGFNESPRTRTCIVSRRHTTQSCARELYTAGVKTAPGTAFFYGPGHMQIAAAMVEKATGQPFAAVFRRYVADPIALSPATDYVIPTRRNPRIASGATTTANDFERLLQALLKGKLIPDLQAFAADRTKDVRFEYRPTATIEDGRDWHYALGSWRECDRTPFDAACSAAPIISSPGAYGWTPWIDLEHDYYGLIAMEVRGLADRGEVEGQPSAASVDLEQTLQPLIVEALAATRKAP